MRLGVSRLAETKLKQQKGCVWACNWAQGVVSAQNKRKNKTGPFGCVVDYAAQRVLGPTWKFLGVGISSSNDSEQSREFS